MNTDPPEPSDEHCALTTAAADRLRAIADVLEALGDPEIGFDLRDLADALAAPNLRSPSFADADFELLARTVLGDEDGASEAGIDPAVTGMREARAVERARLGLPPQGGA